MNSYEKGVAFEKSVAQLFAKLGYKKVIRNRIIDGSRIDITTEHELPDGSVTKHIIECKDYSGNVGIEEVNKFNLVFQNLRNSGKVHKGVIVSRLGFTAPARQAAESYGIELFEYSSLLKRTRREGVPSKDIEPVKEEILNKKYAFVLMPFEKKFEDIYYFGIRGAVEDADFYCERADEIQFTGGVIEKVKEHIKKADVVIAEMTGQNPNVFYEVGIAHAWGKNTILLVWDAGEIPFDLQGQNHIVYSGRIKALKQKLTQMLKALR